MNYSRYIFPIIILLCCNNIALADMYNNCHDPAVLAEWHEKMQRNKHHPEWRTMALLRKQLCNNVDNGELSVEEASVEFERQRAIQLQRFRERLEQKHGKQKATA